MHHGIKQEIIREYPAMRVSKETYQVSKETHQEIRQEIIREYPAMRPASRVAWRCESLKYAGTVITAFFTGRPINSSATWCRACPTLSKVREHILS